jgi:ABC-2 type transport system ATP-binding protein
VLDEPFSGLDPVGVDVLAGVLLERARSGVPVIFSSHQLELVERLCDSVCIVARGRVVASGPVTALREAELQRRPRRLRVTVLGAVAGWTDALPGARCLSTDGDTAVIELDPEASYDVILDAARSLGSVREFAEVRPSLSDLFREAVTA